MRILLHFTQVFIGQCQLRVVEQDNKSSPVILTCESFHKGGYLVLFAFSTITCFIRILDSGYILTNVLLTRNCYIHPPIFMQEKLKMFFMVEIIGMMVLNPDYIGPHTFMLCAILKLLLKCTCFNVYYS